MSFNHEIIGRLAADSINPILIVLILQEPLLMATEPTKAGQRWRRILAFWISSAVAMGIAVVLAENGKAAQIWPGRPGFPSGHTTLATAAVGCLVWQRGARWLFLGVPLVAGMAWGLMVIRAHTPVEIAGGFCLATIVVSLVMRATTRLRHPERPSAATSAD